MTRRRVGPWLALLGLAALAWGSQTAPARAQEVISSGCASGNCAGGGCASGVCQTRDCPPAFHHCEERPPCIRIHCGCPRPVCNPCTLPNWGYFQTCWTPWPLPPDWSHCKVPPPASFVQLNSPNVMPAVPGAAPLQPAPKSSAPPSSAIPPAGSGPGLSMPPLDETEALPAPSQPNPVPGTSKLGR